MPLDTHSCAAPGCSSACPSSHLMCIPHWRMVPASLRREVVKRFRAWRDAVSRANRARQGCTTRTYDTVTALREAQRMAIEQVSIKLQKKQEMKDRGQNKLIL